MFKGVYSFMLRGGRALLTHLRILSFENNIHRFYLSFRIEKRRGIYDIHNKAGNAKKQKQVLQRCPNFFVMKIICCQ